MENSLQKIIQQRYVYHIVVFAIYLATLTISFESPATEQVEAQQKLIILNWPQYIDPTIYQAFEARYHVQIMEINFASDDARDEFILDTDATGYDLIVVSGISLSHYKKRNWLLPIDKSKIPNLRHIHDRWTHAFPDAAEYAAPYFWGTIGIAYRSDLVTEPFNNWQQLYQPAEYLRGKIAMIKYSRDIIGMALKALGYSANSNDPEELSEVESLLREQKPFVKAYSRLSLGVDNSHETSALVSGKLLASMGYSGDVIGLKEQHKDIKYVIPKEGTNLWVDYIAMASNARNKESALKFIDFINEPEIAAQNALYLDYPSPNKAAELLLPESYLKNPQIYPDSETLKKSEFYENLSPKSLKQRNMIFSDIIN